MEEDCLIILDSSGSMNEEGKRIAGEYLLCAIAGFIRDSFPRVRYGAYRWGKSITRYGEKSFDDATVLDAGALATFVAEHQNTPLLLISDGNFSERDCTALAGLPGIERIRAVMIGAEANRPRLQKIIGQSRVFESADAIECARQLLIR
jgi:hypothetical protein